MAQCYSLLLKTDTARNIVANTNLYPDNFIIMGQWA